MVAGIPSTLLSSPLLQTNRTHTNASLNSIPTRRELVKEAARDLSLTETREKQKELLAHRWSQCPLTHQALTPPIVSDCAGELYNKDGVLRYLLAEEGGVERKEAEQVLRGKVRSLKDVVELKFEVEKNGAGRWVCPVTGKELGAGSMTKAVYLVPCGHVFSLEAVTEVKSSDCVQCGTIYVPDRDVVPILPSTEADRALVVDRMDQLRALGLSHSLKKVKIEKKRKERENIDPVADTGVRKKTKDDNEVERDQSSRTEKCTSTTGASSTHNEIQRACPSYENDNIASLYVRKDDDKDSKKKKNMDYMTRGYSIPASAR